jgi:hypothetical protein
MKGYSQKTRMAEPRKTRTNRDWVMILLGVCLIISFLVGGYLSLTGSQQTPVRKFRGPVRDPAALGLLDRHSPVVSVACDWRVGHRCAGTL